MGASQSQDQSQPEPGWLPKVCEQATNAFELIDQVRLQHFGPRKLTQKTMVEDKLDVRQSTWKSYKSGKAASEAVVASVAERLPKAFPEIKVKRLVETFKRLAEQARLTPRQDPKRIDESPIQSLPARFEECDRAIWCKRWAGSERLLNVENTLTKARQLTGDMEPYIEDQDALHGFDVIDQEFRTYLGTLALRKPLPAWAVRELREILEGWWNAVKYACSQGMYSGPGGIYAPFVPSPRDANRTMARLRNAFDEAFSTQLELLEDFEAIKAPG